MNLISRFVRDESGATAIEYGLIAALIAVVIITGVTAVGTSLSTTFNTLSGKLTEVRKNGTLGYLRPDGKSQVTVEYQFGKPKRVDTIVISTRGFRARCSRWSKRSTRSWMRANRTSSARAIAPPTLRTD